MIDNKTTNYNFPLPNAENTLLEDVGRISTAISSIDTQINTLSTSLNSQTSQINSLNTSLSTKISTTDLQTEMTTLQNHIDGEIEDLQDHVDGKFSTLQTHVTTKIANLQDHVDSKFAELATPTTSSPNVIGVPGTQGFGVGTCLDIASLSWIRPMNGTSDITSDNYGNYQTNNGSIMVCVPKFFYRRGSTQSPLYAQYGSNCIDIVGTETFTTESQANAAGYALPRAFIDNGVEKDYFFIDKYKCSNDVSGSCKSAPNVNPISLYYTTDATAKSNYTSSMLYGGAGYLYDAITLSRGRGAGIFQCQSVFINAALQMLIDAHAQASTSAAFCAWFDPSGVTNFPKGCNNNALGDYNDTSVTYAAAYDKKPKTRATGNFAKTTHNGQNCGVADLNGMLYEVLIGVTNFGSSATASDQITNATAYVLKRSAKLADLTSGWNGATDAWGQASTLATRYDLVNDFFIGTNGAMSGKVGNGTYQVFGGEVSGSATEYLRANCGYVKTTDSICSTGTNQYGQDYYNEYNRQNLVVLGSYSWGNSTNAGAFSRNYNYRSVNDYSYGFRACAYN